ncbi:MAG TPA: ATP-binding protein [Gemmatimonadales bacterium]|nr:ATP-binding protein [Gemmatimonadales bacterium]
MIAPESFPDPSEPPAPQAVEYLVAVGVVAGTALLALPLRGLVNTIDVAMVFLLAVVVVAARSSRGPTVLATGLAILAFDVLFVPPYYRLTVDDADYLLTFAVMLIVALVMSGLTVRIRHQALQARWREREAMARLELSQALSGATDSPGVLGVLTDRLQRLLGGAARIVRTDPASPEPPAWPDDGVFGDPEVRMVASLAWRHREMTGRGTAHGPDADALVLPVVIREGVAAVIVFAGDGALDTTPATLALARALLEQGGAVLDRATIAERHDAARIAVAAEQLRTSLLSSLSHDLRTPLANIEGAASSLLEDGAVLRPEVRHELAEGILGESRRMHRLVVNLLDMVRVESGMLAVSCNWQPVEEALGVALIRMEERLAGREVSTDVPADLPLVPIDELLVEQVFINLLENALRHTPPGTPIRVSAWRDGDGIVVEVADRGPGIPEGQQELVFRKFHRAEAPGRPLPTDGSGLGLTICRGIVSAHGGRIWVEPRPGGGAAFRFTLPITGVPPSAPREAGEP